MKRRAEVEKLARERAKVKAQKEEQERASRAVAGVNHLEIPAELAFIFSKLDGKCSCFLKCVYNSLSFTSERNMMKKLKETRKFIYTVLNKFRIVLLTRIFHYLVLI